MTDERTPRQREIRRMAHHAITCRSCLSNAQLLVNSGNVVDRADAMNAIERCSSRTRTRAVHP